MKLDAHRTSLEANFKLAKLLVIEDDDDHWLLMQRALQECLPEVSLSWVNSLPQALSQLEVWQHQEWEVPKLILLDVYMPSCEEGWALLSYIKQETSFYKHIPLVTLSSSASKNDILKAYELGTSSYTIKPHDFEGWRIYFGELRRYWWETVSLPPLQYSL